MRMPAFVPTTTMKLDPDVVVDHWIIRPPAYTPEQLAAAGHDLINSYQDYLYFDENDGDPARSTTDEILWSSFAPAVFHGKVTLPAGPGGTDNPTTTASSCVTGMVRITSHPVHSSSTCSLSRPLRAPGVVPTPTSG